MTRICLICGNRFETPVTMQQLKMVGFHPQVDTAECFKKLLEGNMWTRADINKVADDMGIVIQKTVGFQEFRSGVEQQTADFFKKHGILYEFEKYAFIFKFTKYEQGSGRRPNMNYLPDFFLPEYGVFIEVKFKGCEGASFAKAKQFGKYFPLYIIDREVLKILQGAK